MSLFFASTIFLSSFLLFQVQPLLSKHLLPWFGGGAAVWMVAMFFFMVVLALGYLYALILSRYPLRLQAMVHGILILMTLWWLVSTGSFWPSAITPSYEGVPQVSNDPTLAIFLTLCLSVGLPFFLLSSTSSLLQLWYGLTLKREPFSLYAVSNTGSLLGLLSYPFLIEPSFPTVLQGAYWTWGMMGCATLLFGISVFVYRRAGKEDALRDPAPFFGSVFLRAAVLAAVPVATLLAGTSYLTTHIAPLPLLWVMPLSLYLLSFILSFSGGEQKRPVLTHLVMIGVLALSLGALSRIAMPSSVTILLVLGGMFALFHLCHEALYRLRPVASQLTGFYMALSVGGILGSLSMTVSSLLLLSFPAEFALLLCGAGGVASFKLSNFSALKRLPVFSGIRRQIFLGASTLFFLSLFFVCIATGTEGAVLHARNFFGHKSIVERTSEGESLRMLMHGVTNHGFDVLSGPQQGQPTAYYGEGSGIDRVFRVLKERQEGALRSTIVGLGSGVLAWYCRPGDHMRFYEIDPQVVTLAREQFSFLKRCPQADIVTMDGRLGLSSSEGAEALDLIVIDAYADDMVPAHLLTTGAVRLYTEQLAPQGFLAIHVSSRYLDLKRVMASYEQVLPLSGRVYLHATPEFPSFESLWVVFSRDESAFDAEPFEVFTRLDGKRSIEWTDQYSAVFPLLKR